MIEIKGVSQKQVDYATECRARVIKKMETALQEGRDFQYPQAYLTELGNALEVTKAIDKDAKWWIDNGTNITIKITYGLLEKHMKAAQ